ncbi:GntR family transcriptional regulator [Candidatus Clostridium stratigraminis]|uniref:GntR family transcriptional regulator n=1 Tax=Candidatus Clostridium stratigraminis TaxID=3381661 RepID=A0ABW8T348_9CLOT
MAWELKSDRPIYLQLIEQIEIQIFSGIYEPGSRLPSVRELAQEAGVNSNTMQKALSMLEENGLLYTNRTSGRYITEDTKMIQLIKEKLAKEQISEFLEKMKSLGFAETEILSAITSILKEVK